MPSGWIRWLFEQYEFPFERRLPADARRRQPECEVRRADLRRRRHPVRDGAGRGGGAIRRRPAGRRYDPGGVPRHARPRDGREDGAGAEEVRRERRHASSPSDRRRRSGYHLGLPIKDALVERVADGAERPLPREKFYMPGSILEARIDNTQPARLRHGRARDGLLRRQPGVPARARRRR